MGKLRSIFKTEWVYRLFIVLQAIGIAGIIYLEISSRWSILPEYNARKYDIHTKREYGPYFNWDIIKSRYWTRNHENWIALLCLLGPFLSTKSIDWILDSKHKE
jgi:hypothetical protein